MIQSWLSAYVSQILRRKQNYPITSHATTALCRECNQIRLYAERQPETIFRVMKVGRDVTVDDDGNYMSRGKNSLTFQTNINLQMLKGFLTITKAKFYLFFLENSTIASGEVKHNLIYHRPVFHSQT